MPIADIKSSFELRDETDATGKAGRKGGRGKGGAITKMWLQT